MQASGSTFPTVDRDGRELGLHTLAEVLAAFGQGSVTIKNGRFVVEATPSAVAKLKELEERAVAKSGAPSSQPESKGKVADKSKPKQKPKPAAKAEPSTRQKSAAKPKAPAKAMPKPKVKARNKVKTTSQAKKSRTKALAQAEINKEKYNLYMEDGRLVGNFTYAEIVNGFGDSVYYGNRAQGRNAGYYIKGTARKSPATRPAAQPASVKSNEDSHTSKVDESLLVGDDKAADAETSADSQERSASGRELIKEALGKVARDVPADMRSSFVGRVARHVEKKTYTISVVDSYCRKFVPEALAPILSLPVLEDGSVDAAAVVGGCVEHENYAKLIIDAEYWAYRNARAKEPTPAQHATAKVEKQRDMPKQSDAPKQRDAPAQNKDPFDPVYIQELIVQQRLIYKETFNLVIGKYGEDCAYRVTVYISGGSWSVKKQGEGISQEEARSSALREAGPFVVRNCRNAQVEQKPVEESHIHSCMCKLADRFGLNYKETIDLVQADGDKCEFKAREYVFDNGWGVGRDAVANTKREARDVALRQIAPFVCEHCPSSDITEDLGSIVGWKPKDTPETSPEMPNAKKDGKRKRHSTPARVDFGSVDHTLYICKGTFSCTRKGHHIESATGLIPTINRTTAYINVNYCTECDLYFIGYREYCNYRDRYRALLGNFSFSNPSGGGSGFENLAQESILKLCGYNVNQQTGWSEYERQKILANVMDSGICNKYEIINLLNMNIDTHMYMPNNESAVSKWEADLEFVRNYRIGEQRHFFVRNVKRYGR